MNARTPSPTILFQSLLQRDETRRVRGTDTRPTVLDRLAVWLLVLVHDMARRSDEEIYVHVYAMKHRPFRRPGMGEDLL